VEVKLELTSTTSIEAVATRERLYLKEIAV
jgi:hypothetical protein